MRILAAARGMAAAGASWCKMPRLMDVQTMGRIHPGAMRQDKSFGLSPTPITRC
jgi:hypothetical protein